MDWFKWNKSVWFEWKVKGKFKYRKKDINKAQHLYNTHWYYILLIVIALPTIVIALAVAIFYSLKDDIKTKRKLPALAFKSEKEVKLSLSL